MGILDKLKNALFEEEYVEVEEKPKVKSKPKKEKVTAKKKEVKDTKPIAKKIVLPDKKQEVVNDVDEEPIDEDFDDEPLKKNSMDNNFKFPMVDDGEFNDTNKYNKQEYQKPVQSEPEIINVVEEASYQEEKYDDSLYQGRKDKPLYGIDESSQINVHEYGLYEKEKKIFRPSPIISPIYGVLDKNYKKEEIVNKREVRLTSSYAKENLSVDDVRQKAYGSLSDDIATRMDKEEVPVKEEATAEDSNLLVDLSSSVDKPQVHEVTMGDAEEYFQDLGLEYNIDYKDASKEKATGRRSEKTTPKDSEEEKKEEKVAVTPVEKETASAVDSDDNLFDLIDSMYEEKE